MSKIPYLNIAAATTDQNNQFLSESELSQIIRQFESERLQPHEYLFADTNKSSAETMVSQLIDHIQVDVSILQNTKSNFELLADEFLSDLDYGRAITGKS